MALLDDLQQALWNAYAIERELGGGGISRVFVGEEVALGRIETCQASVADIR